MEENLYNYKASCFRVIDGDTLELDISLGMWITLREKVRLYGIDTPETYGVKKDSEEYKRGIIAKDFVENFVKDKELIIKTYKDKSGKFGRLLASVYVDGACLNDELLKNGLAVKYVK